MFKHRFIFVVAVLAVAGVTCGSADTPRRVQAIAGPVTTSTTVYPVDVAFDVAFDVTTTTTAPAPPPVVHRPTTTTTRPVSTAVSTGPHLCGGDLPPCRVMQHESGGDPTAVNWKGCVLKDGRRGCFGKWQFDWDAWPPGYAGYDRADHAPEPVQDQRAREMWAGGRGCSRWAAC